MAADFHSIADYRVKLDADGRVVKCIHMGGPFPEPLEKASALRCRMAVFPKKSYDGGGDVKPRCYSSNTDCVVFKYLRKYQQMLEDDAREQRRLKALAAEQGEEEKYDERVSGYESYGEDYDPGKPSGL